MKSEILFLFIVLGSCLVACLPHEEHRGRARTRYSDDINNANIPEDRSQHVKTTQGKQPSKGKTGQQGQSNQGAYDQRAGQYQYPPPIYPVYNPPPQYYPQVWPMNQPSYGAADSIPSEPTSVESSISEERSQTVSSEQESVSSLEVSQAQGYPQYPFPYYPYNGYVDPYYGIYLPVYADPAVPNYSYPGYYNPNNEDTPISDTSPNAAQPRSGNEELETTSLLVEYPNGTYEIIDIDDLVVGNTKDGKPFSDDDTIEIVIKDLSDDAQTTQANSNSRDAIEKTTKPQYSQQQETEETRTSNAEYYKSTENKEVIADRIESTDILKEPNGRPTPEVSNPPIYQNPNVGGRPSNDPEPYEAVVIDAYPDANPKNTRNREAEVEEIDIYDNGKIAKGEVEEIDVYQDSKIGKGDVEELDFYKNDKIAKGEVEEIDIYGNDQRDKGEVEVIDIPGNGRSPSGEVIEILIDDNNFKNLSGEKIVILNDDGSEVDIEFPNTSPANTYGGTKTEDIVQTRQYSENQKYDTSSFAGTEFVNTATVNNSPDATQGNSQQLYTPNTTFAYVEEECEDISGSTPPTETKQEPSNNIYSTTTESEFKTVKRVEEILAKNKSSKATDKFGIGRAKVYTQPNQNPFEAGLARSQNLDEPIVWVRGDDNFWKKLMIENGTFDAMYFFNVRGPPFVQKHTNTMFYANGTVVEEITEYIYANEDDDELTEVKKSKVLRYADQPQ